MSDFYSVNCVLLDINLYETKRAPKKNNWSPIPVIMPVVCFTVDNLPNVNKQTNTNNIVSKVQILG